MPIIDMKKVFLLGHQEEREKILNLLHEQNSMQLVDITGSNSWAELEELLEPVLPEDGASSNETDLAEVRYYLDLLQRYYPVRKSFIEQFTGSKIELTEEKYHKYINQKEKFKEISSSCRSIEENISQIQNEETQAANLIEELTPFKTFKLPLEEVKNSVYVATGLFSVAAGSFEEISEQLPETTDDYYLEKIATDSELDYFYFAAPNEDFKSAEEYFKSNQVAQVTFKDLTGTAADNIAAVEEKLERLKEDKDRLLKEIELLTAERPLLMSCYDYLANEHSKTEAALNLAKTENSFLLEGWIPVPLVADLEEMVEEQTETAVLLLRDPEPGEEVPVLLQNRGPSEAYEVVTKLYGSPQKYELDPTPYMAPFFFLIFGICFSDAGYGMVLALLSFLALRKLKLAGGGEQLVKLLFLGGVSSIIFGVLFGSFFGDLTQFSPLWFNPLEDPMYMLIFSFALGLIHIYFGMGLQAYRNIKAGRFWDAVFDQLTWFLFLNGLVMLLLPATFAIGKWLAIGGAAGLILTQGRSQQGIIKKFLSGLVSLYNTTGYLSDVLSYSRLLALGLATGVIASAINAMGGMIAGSTVGTILMILVLIGGHLFNIVISTLSSFVHTSRLQYIEFFGKFFEGGGRFFQPFGKRFTYVDVVGEDKNS